WSPSSESALAEAEIEYRDKKDPAIYVTFKVVEGNDYVENGDLLMIWTTTPWTLPGNLAIAVGSEIEYVRAGYNDKVYVVAKDLIENIFDGEYNVLSSFKGSAIEEVKYENMLMNR